MILLIQRHAIIFPILVNLVLSWDYMLDTSRDLNNTIILTLDCPYWENENFACNGTPIIPIDLIRNTSGFWFPCATVRRECFRYIRRPSSIVAFKITIEAYHYGVNANITITANTDNGEVGTVFTGTDSWQTHVIDENVFPNIQSFNHISIGLTTSQVVFDKLLLEFVDFTSAPPTTTTQLTTSAATTTTEYPFTTEDPTTTTEDPTTTTEDPTTTEEPSTTPMTTPTTTTPTTTSTTTPTTTTEPVPTFHPDCHTYIHLYTTMSTWANARAFCAAQQRELMIIEDEAKYNCILEAISQSATPAGFNFWTGGSDINSEGNFTWQPSGRRVRAFYPDGTGQPTGRPGENCIAFRKHFSDGTVTPQHIMSDEFCDQSNYFICQ